VGKISEKAVCGSIFFDNMALYFECRINKNRFPSDSFLRFCPLRNTLQNY